MRKLMEHINASPTKYRRVTQYTRETLPKLRGNDCVQCFEDLRVLTQRKPVKWLASSYLLNHSHSGIAGYRQQLVATGADKFIYIGAAFCITPNHAVARTRTSPGRG
jgi:hypothetical protein